MPKSPAIKPAAPVIVIGGANMDLKCRIDGAGIMATSNPGGIAFMPGGVGRNVAETLARLGLPTALIAAIGRDGMGDALIIGTKAAGVDTTMILRGRFPTGSYAATLTRDGELMIGVAAMQATQRLTPAVLKRHREQAAPGAADRCRLQPAAGQPGLAHGLCRQGWRAAGD